MREILFRGKTFDGEWVQGDLMHNTDKQPIIGVLFLSMKKVIPETIGQYTDLTDKNGTKIFEGDIIRAFMDFGPASLLERIALVGWHDKYGYQWNYFDTDTIEVIGNIHDNPELLKGGADNE